MVELIMVLLVLGILAGVIINRAGSGQAMLKTDAITTVGAINQANTFGQDIARIQALALNNGVPLRLSITYKVIPNCVTTPSPAVCTPVRRDFKYGVTCRAIVSGTPCSSIGLTFRDPMTGQDFLVSVDNMLTLTASDASGAEALTLDFDSVGRPYVSTGLPATTGLIATNPVRVFSFAPDTTQSTATGTVTLTLRPITGFVEVSG